MENILTVKQAHVVIIYCCLGYHCCVSSVFVIVFMLGVSQTEIDIAILLYVLK